MSRVVLLHPLSIFSLKSSPKHCDSTGKTATTLKEAEQLMIPPDIVKRKLDGVVDSVPPDKGCEVLDGELTHQQWDENNSEILLIVTMATFC